MFHSGMAFHGKVALVTGGGSGMGRVYAQRMADGGAVVALLDVDEPGMQATQRGHAKIHSYVCDVTDAARVNEVVKAIEAEHGALDRVVHCAAIMPTAPVLSEDPALIKKLMDINYGGTVNIVAATLPKMVARGSGDFIVFGSVAGYALTPQMGAYCASKAAVNALVETLIWENKDSNVRIHLTCPPLTDTPLLKQAQETSNPKSIQTGIERNMAEAPEDVVARVEKAVEKGKWISFPGKMAVGLYVTRRLAPNLLWKIILREERRA